MFFVVFVFVGPAGGCRPAVGGFKRHGGSFEQDIKATTQHINKRQRELVRGNGSLELTRGSDSTCGNHEPSRRPFILCLARLWSSTHAPPQDACRSRRMRDSHTRRGIPRRDGHALHPGAREGASHHGREKFFFYLPPTLHHIRQTGCYGSIDELYLIAVRATCLGGRRRDRRAIRPSRLPPGRRTPLVAHATCLRWQ